MERKGRWSETERREREEKEGRCERGRKEKKKGWEKEK